jgi:histidinol phosphatase-like enzyme
MALSEDQVRFYKQTMDMTRQQINDLNVQIEEELAKVKDRLAELQAAKNAAKQIYDGACKMLGVENELETSESETEESEG